jgi:hypothetical protein
MQRRIIALLVVVTLFMVAATARADSLFYAFDQSNYTVAPGVTVPVKVYLEETGGTVLADAGLQGVGLTVSWDNSLTQVLAPADVVLNPSFNVVYDHSAYPTSKYTQLEGGIYPGVVSPTLTAGVYKILVGTFNFTAGATPGVTHLLTADYDPDPMSFDTVTGPSANPAENYAVLDSMIANGAATITVGTTPEPSTLVLSGIAALAFFAFRSRQKTRVA